MIRCLCFACEHGSANHYDVFVICMLYVDVLVLLWRVFFQDPDQDQKAEPNRVPSVMLDYFLF